MTELKDTVNGMLSEDYKGILNMAEQPVSDELIYALAKFANAVQELADYAAETKAENPKCDYIQYLRRTKVGKSRCRRK